MAWIRGLVILVAATATAYAQPKSSAPPLVGVTEVAKLTAANGFIDDAIGADDQRVAYVTTDAASKAELHVASLANQPEISIDITSITLHPIAITLVGGRALVIGTSEDGAQNAALVELNAKAKVVYKLGPATHIVVITRDGKRAIAIDRVTTAKTTTRHETELVSLETGRRIAGGKTFELEAGTNTALDFHVNHWSEGMTRAHGIKGGEWNKKDDQRSPDVEATYDLIAGKIVETTKIADLFEQHKRYQILADAGGTLDFVRIGDKGAELWRAGTPKPLELDQPLASYEPKSVQAFVLPDGSGWMAIKVDPVNPEAVARKKADPEYLDVFRFTADGKAIRKARVLASGVRHRFGVAGDKFWLVERNNGFERGGKNLVVYALAP